MRDVTRADPELLQKLRDGDDDEPVKAAVSIRRERGTKPDPVKINDSAHAAIDRASERVDSTPRSIQIMPKLGVAYVEASGRLIRELINQPEITGAMLGGASGSGHAPA